MKALRTLLAGAVLVVCLQPAQGAWTSGSGEGTAYAMVQADGVTLHIGCNGLLGTRELFLTLSGPVPDYPGLSKTDDARSALMLWIEQPDGRTDRHSVSAHYFAPDEAFVGRALLGEAELDRFGSAARLYLTTVRFDEPLFVTEMKGTAAARAAFRAGCGL